MGLWVLLLRPVGLRAELLPHIRAARRRIRTAVENTQIFTKIGRSRQATAVCGSLLPILFIRLILIGVSRRTSAILT